MAKASLCAARQVAALLGGEIKMKHSRGIKMLDISHDLGTATVLRRDKWPFLFTQVYW